MLSAIAIASLISAANAVVITRYWPQALEILERQKSMFGSILALIFFIVIYLMPAGLGFAGGYLWAVR